MLKLTPFHSWKTKIIPSDCDENGFLKFSRQLKMQENIGTDQFDQCGLSLEKMRENGFAFVIANAAAKYIRIPRQNEEIRLTTMHTHKKGVHLYRAYIFETAWGEPLIEAYNDFILVDSNTHRIVGTEPFDSICEYNENNPQMSLAVPKKVRLPQNLEEAGSVLIERRDIDLNRHLNNSVYWDYIQRFMPCSVTEVEGIRISYLAEGFLGEHIKLRRGEEGEKIFLSGEHERGLSFTAEITKKSKESDNIN